MWGKLWLWPISWAVVDNITSGKTKPMPDNGEFDEADDAYAKQNANKKKNFQIFKSDDDQTG